MVTFSILLNTRKNKGEIMSKISNNSSQNSKNKGFLNDYIRSGVLAEKLSADIKYKLVNEKNGKLTKVLDSIVDDFRLITTNEKTSYLLENYKIRRQLEVLNATLENFLSNSFAPQNRICATVRKGTKIRVFKLERINYSGKKHMALVRGEEYFRGLKENEKEFLSKYSKENGSDYPLEEGKLYTWKEVKTLLLKKLDKPAIQQDELKLQVRKRMKMAREMIEKNIDVNQLRKKTGCNFKIIYESEPSKIKK